MGIDLEHIEGLSDPLDIAIEVRRILKHASNIDSNIDPYTEEEIEKWTKIISTLQSNIGRLSAGNVVHVFRDGMNTKQEYRFPL
ncbi:hypothetical protein BdWA1_001350 [Babesia duncani]|uniref:Uncharacterized protein n=1 Tax=Babesia duncani TaxID=323732 RepID=A0AAD9UQY7_9APIC|nr:hypothetical protein BdWA1_001350 [Babesia duncani]